MKKVNQIQEYFNWIFYLKWSSGSQIIGWLFRLVPLRESKLRQASSTKEANGIIGHGMQRRKTFTNFSPAPIIPSNHYLFPIRGDCSLVEIAHSSQI
ncbi:hypothetical protein [Nostoc sp. NMS4]|uniref:hypothetical protein n=1 Tax=Nostoc sp. NMS4 TaxID=2815390 RepID=UPI0025DFB721|nr:hypothetical protein [Nostoc sp. NMS4]MBN3922349.1 hypothetical protein [Nostoc sp. NMS4]